MSLNENTNNGQHVAAEITPNVVISNPDIRRYIGIALYIISLLAGVAALFLAFFPEFNAGNDTFVRAIAFINAVVSLVSGAFGIVVTFPNVPKSNG